MWRRIQAGLGRIRDSFHGPVQHFADATPLSTASNKPGPINNTERPGRRLRPQASSSAPGSAALNRDKKAGKSSQFHVADEFQSLTHSFTARVNKRRHSRSRLALHLDYVLRLERLVFGLDQIEDDESFSNAVCHLSSSRRSNWLIGVLTNTWIL